MHPFLSMVLRGLRAFGIWAQRALGTMIDEIVRGTGRGLGRLMERAVPWIIGGFVILGIFKFFPEVIGPLAGIGICFYAIWRMVCHLWPGKKK